MTTNQNILEFPCDFPIKVMGKASPEFETFVLSTIRKYAPDLLENSIELRPSGKGNFLSITVTIHAQNKAQLDAIYQELTANKLVLMAL